LKSATEITEWISEIGSEHPAYLCPFPVSVHVRGTESPVSVLSGIGKDFVICQSCALQLHKDINDFIHLPENKKHPITFLIQSYDSTPQSELKDKIQACIQANKTMSLSQGSASLIGVRPTKIDCAMWRQELHYFIVEKLLTLGICRMDVIFKAIKDGVLHIPQSYIKSNNRMHFIHTNIMTLLDNKTIDKKFVSFIVPARTSSMGTAAETLNYIHGALVYSGFCSTLSSGE
jgi:hypothetical protein